MSGDDLSAARERAEAARIELRAAFDDAFDRLSPTRLKAEAAQAASHQINEMKTALRRSVTSHPLIAWPALALILTAIAYMLRAPATALAQGGAVAVHTIRTYFSTRK